MTSQAEQIAAGLTDAQRKASESAREAADTICNPVDNPHMHRILCKKFTQAEARGREQGLREAAAVADTWAAYWPRASGVRDAILALIPGEPK